MFKSQLEDIPWQWLLIIAILKICILSNGINKVLSGIKIWNKLIKW